MSKKNLRTVDLKELVKTTVTCGDCRGLTRDVLIPASTKPCESLGKLEDSKMCKHFRTNTYDLKELMETGGDGLVALFQLFGGMEEKDLRIIAGMLLSESRTRKQGVKMGQPVFVRYRGRESRNYMNNFMAARILDMDDKEVRLISETGNIVLDLSEHWIGWPFAVFEIRIQIVVEKDEAEGRINDPEREISTSKRYLPEEDVKFKVPTLLDGFTVPNMDDIVKGKGGKKKRRSNTLVDLVSMIDNGGLLGAFSEDEDGALELGEDQYQKPAHKSKKVKPKAKVKKKPKMRGPIEMGDM